MALDLLGQLSLSKTVSLGGSLGLPVGAPRGVKRSPNGHSQTKLNNAYLFH
jgi:hypothetical protein